MNVTPTPPKFNRRALLGALATLPASGALAFASPVPEQPAPVTLPDWWEKKTAAVDPVLELCQQWNQADQRWKRLCGEIDVDEELPLLVEQERESWDLREALFDRIAAMQATSVEGALAQVQICMTDSIDELSDGKLAMLTSVAGTLEALA